MRSESDAQKRRPAMLNRLSRPANPAAADGETRPAKTSWIIGEAMPSTPMPALTLRHRTAHSSQNWRVRQATSAVTDGETEAGAAAAGGVQPSGAQPGGGRR